MYSYWHYVVVGSVQADGTRRCTCVNGGSCGSDGQCICPTGYAGQYCGQRKLSALFGLDGVCPAIGNVCVLKP